MVVQTTTGRRGHRLEKEMTAWVRVAVFREGRRTESDSSRDDNRTVRHKHLLEGAAQTPIGKEFGLVSMHEDGG